VTDASQTPHELAHRLNDCTDTDIAVVVAFANTVQSMEVVVRPKARGCATARACPSGPSEAPLLDDHACNPSSEAVISGLAREGGWITALRLAAVLVSPPLKDETLEILWRLFM
jgi:hypothetical protein